MKKKGGGKKERECNRERERTKEWNDRRGRRNDLRIREKKRDGEKEDGWIDRQRRSGTWRRRKKGRGSD